MSDTVSNTGAAAPDLLALLEARGAERCLLWTDRDSGLRAVLVIDSLVGGRAAGGIRTRSYPDLQAAAADAADLARAMTRKCAAAGLDSGGAKCVVLDHPGLDRPRAFTRLGQLVDELGGLFRTAGDLGTTSADLAAMAAHTTHVHTDEPALAAAVGRGLLRCIEACADVRGVPVPGLRIAIQGCGAIGTAVARALTAAGATVLLADIDRPRAEALAVELAPAATVLDPAHILDADVDIISPCAVGGVLTPDLAHRLRAWAVCGAANNILATPAVAPILASRHILHVPDHLASAGAVIAGLADDPDQKIDNLRALVRDGLRFSGFDDP